MLTLTVVATALLALSTVQAYTPVCLSGWYAGDNSCYLFRSSPKAWADAKRDCEGRSSHLAVIKTETEASIVRQIRNDNHKTNNYYWIGAYNYAGSYDFWWIGIRTKVHHSLWYAGEPNQVASGRKLCVDLGVRAQQLKMNDYQCTASLPFLCEKNCPPGWYLSKGSCYLFRERGLSWDAARTYCQRYGADLAVVDTHEKAQRIRNMRIALHKQNNYYWIGAENTRYSDIFYWIRPGAGHVNDGLWYAGEPNEVNSGKRLCVDLGIPAQNMKMNDYRCSANLPFICEK